MKTNQTTTSRSIRLTLLPLLMLFIAFQLNAQPPRGVPGGRGPGNHHRFDSVPKPPFDTTRVHHHDSIPPIHPPHPDSANTGPEHPKHRPHPHRPFPFPHDSTWSGHHGDSGIIAPDTIIHHRPHRPHPPIPFPHDTTHHNGPGVPDTNHPHPPVPPHDTTGHTPGGPGTPDTSHHPHPPVPPRDSAEHGDNDTTGHHRPGGPGTPPDTADHDGPKPPFPTSDTTTQGGGRPHHKIGYLDNSTNAMNVQVYPNPVVSVSTIHIENAQGTVTFRLFETTGRMVSIQTGLTNGNYQLSKENLSPGVYLYEMLDGNTSRQTGSLIIQ